MNGYFDRLGEELRLATELRYAHHADEYSNAANVAAQLSRWRHRVGRFARGRVGRWPRLGILAIFVVSASAAAAAIPLLGGSQRLSGTVPHAALTSPGRIVGPAAALLPDRLPNGLRYAIPVTPDLEAGNAGWCAYPVFALAGSRTPLPGGGGACAPASPGSVVIVAGGEPLTNLLGRLSPSRPASSSATPPSIASFDQALRHAAWLNFFVVRAAVAVIKLDARSFVTQRDPELAPGWRGLVAFTRGQPTTIRFLDHGGHPITQAPIQPVRSVPVTTVDPRHLPSSACSLGPSNLAGLGSEWEVVANAAPSRGRRVDPDVLLSCARAWYAFPSSRSVYSAAILLNALNPVSPAPNLPGLRPSTRPGDYQEVAGQTSARRFGNAWLFVQGPTQQLREQLLHDISIGGTMIHR